MSKKKQSNQYIPKYIVSKPWYREDQNGNEASGNEDYLSHHRNGKEIVDHSVAQAGQGISDDFDESVRKESKFENYDSKRDRWYGYSTEEWLAQVKNWRSKHGDDIDGDGGRNDDSDDTDYELELQELGIDKSEVGRNIKKDPMEKMLRDRQDVPTYIENINSSANGKIRIEYDPKSRLAKDLTKGFLNDRNMFVKKLDGEAQKLEKLQTLAWEMDKKDLEARKTVQIQAGREHLPNGSDLNLSIEASPTLLMMKARKDEEAAKQSAIAKRRKIHEMYSSDSK
ncbi:uncharacterized protein LODBEIA_P32020 [Lodderomyces beijingensis]|uniref:Pre-mRNA-splicing factor SLU7 n=1 Tax=Lodderomyces beijingensis TaxID=1775926 RepID=A0ABP0ZLE8_9ASCO